MRAKMLVLEPSELHRQQNSAGNEDTGSMITREEWNQQKMNRAICVAKKKERNISWQVVGVAHRGYESAQICVQR